MAGPGKEKQKSSQTSTPDKSFPMAHLQEASAGRRMALRKAMAAQRTRGIDGTPDAKAA
jgi:hypothetical protein